MNSTNNRSRLPPLERTESVIADAVFAGTGAVIISRINKGDRSSLQVGFGDLGWNHTPFIEIRPHGLKRFMFQSGFGRFARDTINRMNGSDRESQLLAFSLMESLNTSVERIDLPRMDGGKWPIDRAFKVGGRSKALQGNSLQEKLEGVAREIIAPIMSAFAELNGYDVIEDEEENESFMEGQVKVSEIKRRERNPRNRLLALRIHGDTCKVCEKNYSGAFGLDRAIIDIHHIQPLGESGDGHLYDPRTDLVPLCPNCHRAAHMRKPIPYTVNELRGMLSEQVFHD